MAAEFPQEWFSGLDMKKDVLAQTYDVKVRALFTLHTSHFTLHTSHVALQTSHFYTLCVTLHDFQREAQIEALTPTTVPTATYFVSKYSPPPLPSLLCHTKANTYGVTCGGGLDMWEGNGWIADCDPYGWFQWYCRFYLGRRCSDDERQIQRGNGVMGPRGRWRNNLTNKVTTQ